MEVYGQFTTPLQAAPAGWYPLNGELRYWDGQRWSDHRQPMPPQYAIANNYGYARQPFGPVITDARTNPIEVIIAWVLTLLTLGYFLPWAIAATRGKSNSLAVGLLSFLLGWTFIGWVVALAMACSPHQVAGVRTW